MNEVNGTFLAGIGAAQCSNIIQIGSRSLFTQFLALRAHGEVGDCSAVHWASQSRMFDIDESQWIL